MVKYERLILGAHPTRESALREAQNINATCVSVVGVTLRIGSFQAETTPVCYIIVPSEHACPACGQQVCAE